MSEHPTPEPTGDEWRETSFQREPSGGASHLPADLRATAKRLDHNAANVDAHERLNRLAEATWELRIAADALEEANLKVAKLQAELDASLRERDELIRQQARGGTCGAKWWVNGEMDKRPSHWNVCVRLPDHSDDYLPDKGVGSRHCTHSHYFEGKPMAGASWGNLTEQDVWRLRAEAAEQQLEKIREWGRTSGITIPQEESLVAILDPVQTEGEG